jgi:dCMP deaminase
MEPRKDNSTWDEFFMETAICASKRSKDPCKQVGACVVDRSNRIIGVGYNGLPAGIPERPELWGKDPGLYNKRFFVIHAEMNAILNTLLPDLQGTVLYCTYFPCSDCAKVIIQKGIREIVYAHKPEVEKYTYAASELLLELAGVRVRSYNLST